MNRRGFLGALLGGLAALSAPFTAAKPLVGWKVYSRPAVLNEAWLCNIEHLWFPGGYSPADPLCSPGYLAVKCTVDGKQYGKAYAYSDGAGPGREEVAIIKRHFLNDLRAGGISV